MQPTLRAENSSPLSEVMYIVAMRYSRSKANTFLVLMLNPMHPMENYLWLIPQDQTGLIARSILKVILTIWVIISKVLVRIMMAKSTLQFQLLVALQAPQEK